MAGPDFGPEQGTFMPVVRALYGLKLYGSAFRDLLSEQFHDLDFRVSIAEPDVCMIPEIKPGGFMYYEYVLCYVVDVLCSSDDPL